MNATDMGKLMSFYESGRREIGDFRRRRYRNWCLGVLSSPDFLYRIIPQRGEGALTAATHRSELASRLSFFVWTIRPTTRAAGGDQRQADGAGRILAAGRSRAGRQARRRAGHGLGNALAQRR
ncbi:MAG: hypothetical protein IPM70_00635 [Proteobacteria bacterium]|nr:hypothetical protein [Pseudomonadota bacterium]